MELVAEGWGVSAMGSVCLLPGPLPCHLERPLGDRPVRQGNQGDEPAGRHQGARRDAAVEQQAGRQRAGGKGEHEPADLRGRDPSADRVGHHPLQQGGSAGPEDASPGVRDRQRQRRVPDGRAERERHVAERQEREGARNAPAQPAVVGAGEAEGREGAGEASHPARGPEHGDARAVAVREDLLAEIRQQDQHAAQGEPEAGLHREQGAHAAVRRDVTYAVAQVAQPEQILDLQRWSAALLHDLQRLPVEAPGMAGRQAPEQHCGPDEAERVADEGRVPAHQGQRDTAQGRARRERRRPEGVLECGRERVVLPADEVGQHRLLGRLEERADHGMKPDHAVGDPDLVGAAHEQETEDQARPQDVADDQEGPPGDPVREHARGRPGEEHRDEPGEQRVGDRLAFAGQLQQERKQGDHVEPVAELRDGVRGVQCAEIAVVPQDADQASNCEGDGQGVAFILDAMAFDVRPRQAAHWAALVLLCAGCLVGLFFLTLPSAEPLRNGNPATTALMQARLKEAQKAGGPGRHNQHWVPMNQISIWLIRAVVNSEDARFFEHDGIDGKQTRIALTTALEDGHFGRGASTITQQLAKNLWLGEQRTLWRKLREAILARRLERLGKKRVLELYLNVAEWGDGIYGADAAARVWFGKTAADLMPEEAAILAAMLPAPRKRSPTHPSAALIKRSFEILRLYSMYNELSPEELADSRWRLDYLLRRG